MRSVLSRKIFDIYLLRISNTAKGQLLSPLANPSGALSRMQVLAAAALDRKRRVKASPLMQVESCPCCDSQRFAIAIDK